MNEIPPDHRIHPITRPKSLFNAAVSPGRGANASSPGLTMAAHPTASLTKAGMDRQHRHSGQPIFPFERAFTGHKHCSPDSFIQPTTWFSSATKSRFPCGRKRDCFPGDSATLRLNSPDLFGKAADQCVTLLRSCPPRFACFSPPRAGRNLQTRPSTASNPSPPSSNFTMR